MLKNVSIAKEVLESMGFVHDNPGKGERTTIMKHGSIIAEIRPNGSVDIGGNVTDFKSVKKRKIKIAEL